MGAPVMAHALIAPALSEASPGAALFLSLVRDISLGRFITIWSVRGVAVGGWAGFCEGVVCGNVCARAAHVRVALANASTELVSSHTARAQRMAIQQRGGCRERRAGAGADDCVQ